MITNILTEFFDILKADKVLKAKGWFISKAGDSVLKIYGPGRELLNPSKDHLFTITKDGDFVIVIHSEPECALPHQIAITDVIEKFNKQIEVQYEAPNV